MIERIPLPPPRSPMNYFQERHLGEQDGAWRVLVVSMMLNQTSGKQLDRVHETFFFNWPTAKRAAAGSIFLMSNVLRPLGFYNRRALAITKMSSQFVAGKWTAVRELYGIGKYASDSYDIFVRGIVPPDVQDKELRRYLSWVEGYLEHAAHVHQTGISDVPA